MLLRACFLGARDAGRGYAEAASHRAPTPTADEIEATGSRAPLPRTLEARVAPGLQSHLAINEVNAPTARISSPVAPAAGLADTVPASLQLRGPTHGAALAQQPSQQQPVSAHTPAAGLQGAVFEKAPLELGNLSLTQRSGSSHDRGSGGGTSVGISHAMNAGGPLPPPPTAGPGAGAVGAPPLPGPSPAGKPAGSGGSIRLARQQGLHAAPYTELSPSEVSECAPHEILNGIGLSFQQLGRGSFGVVVAGTYNGLACAVKVMVTNQLNKPALRELLLSPAINHASLVQTFTSRCARLSHGFFDLLESAGVQGATGTTGATGAAGGNSKPHRSRPRRALQPIPLLSSDGFGDPGCGVAAGDDPYRVLHMVLHDVIAETNQFMIVIVQELCSGTLHAAIRAGAFRPIPTNPNWNLRLARRALLRTALEMARGLLHLHDTGLVHGDLKPHNVLLAKSHDDRRGFKAKVADFGLSHVLPQRANSVSTDSFGSPAYMAPEAFSGKASKATDVYSFGVCLWELLCGRTPYSDVQGVRNVVAELAAGRAPALVWPDGAEMTDGIIALGRRCMSPRPEDRPDLKEVLEEIIEIERIIRADLLAPAMAALVAAATASATL